MDYTKVKEDFLKAATFRHACKEFDKDKKISSEDFQFILDIANLSPTSMGLQAYKILVIQNPDIRKQIAAHSFGAVTQLPTASHIVFLVAAKSPIFDLKNGYIDYVFKEFRKMPEDLYQAYLGKFKQFHEDDLRIAHDDELIFFWSTRQTYILLANMMQAAAAINIDSCPIEGFNRAKIDAILEKECGLNLGEYGSSVMLALGYRKGEPMFPKLRQPLDSKAMYF